MLMHIDYMRDKHGRLQPSKRVIAVLPSAALPLELPTRPYEIRSNNYPPENRLSNFLFPGASERQREELEAHVLALSKLGLTGGKEDPHPS